LYCGISNSAIEWLNINTVSPDVIQEYLRYHTADIEVDAFSAIADQMLKGANEIHGAVEFWSLD
jgi:hypothetical protein